MTLLTELVVSLVALLHACFLVLEMFLWDKPAGLKAFGQTKAQAGATKVLAANQGLYNGFISAGLIFGLLQGDDGYGMIEFFLSCVIVAGVFGAFTASRKILFIQALPGIIGLLLVIFTK